MSNIVSIDPTERDVNGVLEKWLGLAPTLSTVVVVGLCKDGDILVGHSAGSYLTKLGLCNIATTHLEDECRE